MFVGSALLLNGKQVEQKKQGMVQLENNKFKELLFSLPKTTDTEIANNTTTNCKKVSFPKYSKLRALPLDLSIEQGVMSEAKLKTAIMEKLIQFFTKNKDPLQVEKPIIGDELHDFHGNLSKLDAKISFTSMLKLLTSLFNESETASNANLSEKYTEPTENPVKESSMDLIVGSEYLINSRLQSFIDALTAKEQQLLKDVLDNTVKQFADNISFQANPETITDFHFDDENYSSDLKKTVATNSNLQGDNIPETDNAETVNIKFPQQPLEFNNQLESKLTREQISVLTSILEKLNMEIVEQSEQTNNWIETISEDEKDMVFIFASLVNLIQALQSYMDDSVEPEAFERLAIFERMLAITEKPDYENKTFMDVKEAIVTQPFNSMSMNNDNTFVATEKGNYLSGMVENEDEWLNSHFSQLTNTEQKIVKQMLQLLRTLQSDQLDNRNLPLLKQTSEWETFESIMQENGQQLEKILSRLESFIKNDRILRSIFVQEKLETAMNSNLSSSLTNTIYGAELKWKLQNESEENNNLATRNQSNVASTSTSIISIDFTKLEKDNRQDDPKPIPLTVSFTQAKQMDGNRTHHGQPLEQKIDYENFTKEFQSILAKSSLLKAGSTQKLLLKLYPEHLGTLKIELIQSAQGITAKIIASTELAKEMLESQIHQLRHAFVQQNLDVNRIDLQTIWQEDHQQNEEGQGKGQNQAYEQPNDEKKDTNGKEDEESLSFNDVLVNLKV